MKTYFRKEECPHCHGFHDATEMVCPQCGASDPSRRDFHAFENQVREPYGWQLGFFLIQLVGFQALGILIDVIMEVIYISGNPGVTTEDILAYFAQPTISFALTAISYLLVAGIFFLIFGVRRRLPRLFESFKNYKSVLAGVIGAVAIVGFQIVYNLIVGLIFQAAGYQPPTINNNEATIRQMCVALPVGCMIVFGIVGPFTEEIGYRVGLFGFGARLGKAMAYVLSAVIFGFIHFNWPALWTPELQGTLPNELANMPAYIGSGLALAFLYDRFGFAASLTAHTINNVYSIASTIIQGVSGNV